MVIYLVRDAEDAKVIADIFGMDVPEGRGRFPIKRLAEIVESKGYALDVSQYGTSTTQPNHYKVVALVPVGANKFEVSRTVVNSQEVRSHIGHTVRGRLSFSDIGATAAKTAKWRDYEIVSVERL